MIEAIEIRNFQIHKKTKIDFVPGINIISGTSDNGKSSIIRAFRWVLENRPQGYSFRRWGTPDKAVTAVDLHIDEELISRKRGNVKNEYVFQDTVYKALRSDVPDPIKEHLETLSFNIQMQSGRVFLFEYSDSEVAKMINDVSGISVIDDILKESNRRLRELNAEEKLLKEMIKDKKVQKTTYKSFVGLRKKSVILKEKIEDVEAKKEELDEIETDLSNFRRLKQKKKLLPDVSGIEESLISLSKKQSSIEKKQSVLDDLEESVYILENSELIPQKDIDTMNKRINALEKKLSKLDSLVGSMELLEEDIEQVDSLVSIRKKNKLNLKVLNDDLESAKKECGMCPVCDKPW